LFGRKDFLLLSNFLFLILTCQLSLSILTGSGKAESEGIGLAPFQSGNNLRNINREERTNGGELKVYVGETFRVVKMKE